MRRISMLFGIAALVAGVSAGLATSQAQGAKAKKAKMAVCHRGHTIRIGQSAVMAHLRHGDRLGTCRRLAPVVRLGTDLKPVEGATGRGRAVVRIVHTRSFAAVCYSVRVAGVQATAAHIHTSTATTIGGQSFAVGAIVVPLKTPNAKGVARACTAVPVAVARALAANPGNFYVNVHSQAFPNGQVQGTLAKL